MQKAPAAPWLAPRAPRGTATGTTATAGRRAPRFAATLSTIAWTSVRACGVPSIPVFRQSQRTTTWGRPVRRRPSPLPLLQDPHGLPTAIMMARMATATGMAAMGRRRATTGAARVSPSASPAWVHGAPETQAAGPVWNLSIWSGMRSFSRSMTSTRLPPRSLSRRSPVQHLPQRLRKRWTPLSLPRWPARHILRRLRMRSFRMGTWLS
mmetsp:Transcript_36575/g.94967  ORF Transcript_36575/g.94967 Transcript_36575/m.94967 type:complete len:209 (-) Transcript_36575:1222-1848(-)